MVGMWQRVRSLDSELSPALQFALPVDLVFDGRFEPSIVKLPVLALNGGQKFGEYSPTRTYYGHAADKKAKRK